MSNKINIKFAAQGHPGVIAAVKALNKQVASLTAQNRMLMGAQGPLTKAQQQTANAFAAQTRAARNTGGALSVLRSNMLLATFGATIFAASILKVSNMAGDAAEQLSKATVVFGASTDEVLQFAETTADATGRSTQSLIAMTASVQDILVPMGMMRHEASNLSKEIVKAAIDVASFNNVSETTAMRDFNSALVGNHETVRKYGIVISEARMQHIAFETGIIDSKRELTDQEKIMARLAIIQRDSADAQGDAIRTADSYANVMKALGSQFEETAIKMGQTLMPIIKATAQAFTFLLKQIGNPAVIAAFTVTITSLGFAYFITAAGAMRLAKATDQVSRATKAASKSVKKFLKWLIIIEGISYLWGKAFPTKDDSEEAAANLKSVTEAMKEFSDQLKGMTTEQLESQIIDIKFQIDQQGFAKGQQTLDAHLNVFRNSYMIMNEELGKKVNVEILSEADLALLVERLEKTN